MKNLLQVVSGLLAGFSALAVFGILLDPTGEGAAAGLFYAAAVLVQSILTLVYINQKN